MLNQQWLTTFITLVEVGHFTQTAEKLFMTQPGVSQHIKKLEQQVNHGLINRIGKRFELTDAGIALFEYAKLQQTQQQELLRTMTLDDPFVGACRIGCSGSMAALLYPHLIAHQQQHQNLSMHLEAGPNQRILSDLQANKIDIGILTHQVTEADCTSVEIGKQSLCLVLPKRVQGKSFSKQVTFESLAKLGMINHPDAKHYWQQITQAFFHPFQQQADKIDIKGYVNQLNQILLPVASGLGFTVLPEFAVRSFSQPQDIQIGYLDKLAIQLFEPLYLAHKRYRPLARRYEKVQQLITALI
jgi:DNA-binding transcriptional LysR family regulator